MDFLLCVNWEWRRLRAGGWPWTRAPEEWPSGALSQEPKEKGAGQPMLDETSMAGGQSRYKQEQGERCAGRRDTLGSYPCNRKSRAGKEGKERHSGGTVTDGRCRAVVFVGSVIGIDGWETGWETFIKVREKVFLFGRH